MESHKFIPKRKTTKMFGKSLLLLALVGAELAKSNGEAMPVVSSEGQTVYITCDEGYSASQTQPNVNNKSSIQVNCVQDCGAFPVVNGVGVSAGTSDGTTVTITCSIGTNAVSETATCINGAWHVADAVCVPVCGELVVENGETVPAGVVYEQTILVGCNAGFTANSAQTTCNNGAFSEVKCESENSGCILLIGGLFFLLPSGTPAIEYYHPTEGVECNLDTVGNMSTDGVDETTFTSACYLSATRQIVIREGDMFNKPPIVYGLEDGSSTALPLIHNNEYVGRSTTSSVGTSKCISCGGRTYSTWSMINNCYQFDPSLDASKWTPIAPMPEESYAPASVSLTENDFYVVSGQDSSNNFPSHVYHYNVGDETWATEPSMIAGRAEHAAAPLSDTEFIVCGGINATATLSSCEIYDATQKKWRTTGSLSYARSGHIMIYFGGDVYAFDGDIPNGNRVEKYDRATGMWEMGKALKNERAFFVGVAV